MVMFVSALEAAAAVRDGTVSARELTEVMLDRIDEVGPAVNAVVALRREEALREAGAADAAITRGDAPGPLHGVPVTVKESFDVAGMPTTWGDPAFAGSVAERDATVVRRLREAGAIVVGKSNVHQMLEDFGQTVNELYGRTRNPWDLTRSPGGSTGGGAAALAAGMTFLEYGSDLVGSIRIPAGFCGVYGLKPSVNTVPLTGFQAPGQRAEPGEPASVGPLARTAGDLRTALRVTAGPEEPAARAYSWRLPPPRHRTMDRFRVGVVLDHPAAAVTGEVGDVLSAAVDALDRAGAKIVEGWPDGIDPVREAEAFGFQVGLFFAFQQIGADFATLPQVVAHQARRMAVRAAWARYFEDVDVFLCPVNFTPAFPHDDRPFTERTIGEHRYDQQVFWVTHASLPGLPAVSAPAGLSASGLPVGVQIIGPPHEDDTAITFAELAAAIIGGYTQPPI